MLLRIVSFLFIVLKIGIGCAQSVPQSGTIDTIFFKVNSEGFALDAKLLKPAQAIRPMPALIFLVGSSKSSTIKNYQDLTQFYLDDVMLSYPVAIIYFDKRGVGASEGNWYKTSFEKRAEDAKNVALALRNYKDIDSSKIFLVGHSQGGWITQVALAQYPDIFAGGISMAGPTFSVKKQIINDYYSTYLCENQFSEKKAYRKAKNRVNREFLLVSMWARAEQHKQLNVIKKFTPTPYLQKLRKPLLLLFGENDRLVNPAWAQEALKEVYPNQLPEYVSTYIAPGQSHSFKVAPLCYKGKQKDIAFSVETQQVIKQWLIDQFNE